MAQLFQVSKVSNPYGKNERGLGGKIFKSIGGAYGAGQDEDLLKKLRKKQDIEKATSDIMSVYDQKMAPPGAPAVPGAPVVPGTSEFRSSGSGGVPGTSELGGLPGDSISDMPDRTEYEQSVREGLAGGEVGEGTPVGAAIRAYERAHPNSLVNPDDPNTLKKVAIFLARMAMEDPRKGGLDAQKHLLEIEKQEQVTKDANAKNAIELEKNITKNKELNHKIDKMNKVEMPEQKSLDEWRKADAERQKVETATKQKALDVMNTPNAEKLVKTQQEMAVIIAEAQQDDLEIRDGQRKSVSVGENLKELGEVGEGIYKDLFDGPDSIIGEFDYNNDGSIQPEEAKYFTRETWLKLIKRSNEAIREQQQNTVFYLGKEGLGARKDTLLGKIKDYFPDGGGSLKALEKKVYGSPGFPAVRNDPEAKLLFENYNKSLEAEEVWEGTYSRLDHLYQTSRGLNIGKGIVSDEDQEDIKNEVSAQWLTGNHGSLSELMIASITAGESPLVKAINASFGGPKLGTDEFWLQYLAGPELKDGGKNVAWFGWADDKGVQQGVNLIHLLRYQGASGQKDNEMGAVGVGAKGDMGGNAPVVVDIKDYRRVVYQTHQTEKLRLRNMGAPGLILDEANEVYAAVKEEREIMERGDKDKDAYPDEPVDEYGDGISTPLYLKSGKFGTEPSETRLGFFPTPRTRQEKEMAKEIEKLRKENKELIGATP
jgi:hypothetical protein